MSTEQKLTAEEKRLYAACKKDIFDGLPGVFKVGERLKQVREGKLYREEFDTFEAFCQQTYKLGKAYAYRLIDATEVKTSPMGDKITNERQARELVKAAPEARPSIIAEASKDGPITAKKIKEAVDKTKSVDADIIEKDCAGYTIPKETLPLWEERHKIQDVLKLVSRAKCAIEDGRQKQDKIFLLISQAAVDHLSRAYQYVTDAKAYAVCLKCQGRNIEKCDLCKGTGLIKENTYLSKNLEPLRIIREKSYRLQPAL